MILDNDGQIYTFGNNYYGQLGLGDNTDRNTYILIPDIHNIIAISGSRFHSMILNNIGQIYTFGGNHYGQLGLEDNTERNIPTLLNINL